MATGSMTAVVFGGGGFIGRHLVRRLGKAGAGVREWYVHEPEFYYDLLAPHAARLDLWVTDYIHVMDGAAGIVEWYKGTGLRPFLDALPNDAERENFLADYTDRIAEAYPAQPDGRVLFPFRRFFLVAYR